MVINFDISVRLIFQSSVMICHNIYY